MEQETPIEQIVLKGVSVKLMATIIVATITICGTFLGTYYRFQNELANTVREVSTQAALSKDLQNAQHAFDLRLQQMQLQINTQEIRLSEIEKKIK